MNTFHLKRNLNFVLYLSNKNHYKPLLHQNVTSIYVSIDDSSKEDTSLWLMVCLTSIQPIVSAVRSVQNFEESTRLADALENHLQIAVWRLFLERSFHLASFASGP